jgi:hypothetical protein
MGQLAALLALDQAIQVRILVSELESLGKDETDFEDGSIMFAVAPRQTKPTH